jgi:hypothetical protein
MAMRLVALKKTSWPVLEKQGLAKRSRKEFSIFLPQLKAPKVKV